MLIPSKASIDSVKLKHLLTKFVKVYCLANILTAIYNYIFRTFRNILRLHIISKLHINSLYLRPIVSTIRSPTYYLKKFFATFVTNNISTSSYNVKNSLEFKKKIHNQNLPPNNIMVSFDVTSLFTNVTKSLVTNVIENNYSH